MSNFPIKEINATFLGPGQMWGLGKTYGEIEVSGSSRLFNAWSPDVWNSYCLRASNKN